MRKSSELLPNPLADSGKSTLPSPFADAGASVFGKLIYRYHVDTIS